MADWLDEAAEKTERERQAVLARRRDEEAAEAKPPLSSLCIDCHDEISQERRAVNPLARRCVRCQELHERRARKR